MCCRNLSPGAKTYGGGLMVMMTRGWILLLLFLNVNECHGAVDPWALTKVERNRCALLKINSRAHNIQVMVPTGATFRGNQVSVNGKPWVSVAERALSTPKQAADFARRTNLQVVALEEDFVVVDAGRQGYYFYLHFADGDERCVFFHSGIPSKEDCLFRVRCLRTATATQADAVASTVGDPVLAGKPIGTAPRIHRAWKDGNGLTLQGLLTSATQKQATIVDSRGESVTVDTHQLDRESSLICLRVMPLFALETMLTLRAQTPGQPESERGDAYAEAKGLLNSRHFSLCYRVTAVTEYSDPAGIESRQQQYRLSLRPLYCLNPAPHDGRSPQVAYLKECFVPASSFAIAEFDPEETTIEFTGQKVFEGSHPDFVPHIQLTYGAGRTATFGFQPNGARVYVDDSGDAIEVALHQELTEEPPGNWKPLPHPMAPQRKAFTAEADSSIVADPQKDGMPRSQARQAGHTQVRNRAVNANSGDLTGRQRHNTGEIAATFPGRKSLAGSNKKLTINCAGQRVSIAGSDNEITVTGNCSELSLAGSRNTIRMQAVKSISVAGRENVITYTGERPQIRGSLSRNQVARQK